jgi:hypothetical protein
MRTGTGGNGGAATAGVELIGVEKSYRTSRGVVPAVRGIDVSVAVLDAPAADHPAVGARVPARQGADRLRDGAADDRLPVRVGRDPRGPPPGRALAGEDRVDPRRLLPFAALGVFVGHLLTADTIGPAAGGLVSLLALVSGTWFPVTSGFLHDVARFLPSYWLVQAGHVSLGGAAWPALGWIVVAAWTVVLAVLARAAYRRDTQRV